MKHCTTELITKLLICDENVTFEIIVTDETPMVKKSNKKHLERRRDTNPNSRLPQSWQSQASSQCSSLYSSPRPWITDVGDVQKQIDKPNEGLLNQSK